MKLQYGRNRENKELKMRNYILRFSIFFLILIKTPLIQAAPFTQEWTSINGAKFYEYEIAISPKFDDKQLLRQGKTNSTKFEDSLQPGIYFLRVRGVSDSGPGSWSPPKKFIISSNSPDFKWPLDNDRIFVSKTATTVSFEWELVSGADDYVLEIRNTKDNKQKYSFISSDPFISTKELKPGKWSAKVVSRLKEKLFTSGKAIEFEIEERELPSPYIMEPINDLALPSGETWYLRWIRNVSGNRSEIIITELGSERHVVAQFWTKSKDRAILPRLVSGRYQITVRDYLDNSNKYSEAYVNVTMKDGAFSYYSKKTGWYLRVLAGAKLGWHSQKNFSTGNDSWLVAEKFENNLDFRLAGDIWRKLGFETKLGFEFPEYKDSQNRYDRKEIHFQFGGTYSQNIAGPQNFIRYKLAASYRQIPTVVVGDTGEYNFLLWGLKPGIEFQWSSWRSYWDFWSELTLDFPIWSKGRAFGTGSQSPFMPAIEMSFLFRREISSSWRLVTGPSFYLQSLKVKENDRSVKTQIQKAQASINLGLEFDI